MQALRVEGGMMAGRHDIPPVVRCGLCDYRVWSDHYRCWFCSELNRPVPYRKDGCTFGRLEDDEGGADDSNGTNGTKS